MVSLGIFTILTDCAEPEHTARWIVQLNREQHIFGLRNRYHNTETLTRETDIRDGIYSREVAG